MSRTGMSTKRNAAARVVVRQPPLTGSINSRPPAHLAHDGNWRGRQLPGAALGHQRGVVDCAGLVPGAKDGHNAGRVEVVPRMRGAVDESDPWDAAFRLYKVSRTQPRQMRNQVGQGIFTIDDVLTPDECREYIEWSEALGYDAAPVSLAGGAVHCPDIRNNARVMVESPDKAQELWRRVARDIPSVLEGRHAVGLNERLRFYRYGPGQRFAPHTDGCVRRANGEESLLTFMIYLNGGVQGGETRFANASITPQPGLALVFDHYLLHEGGLVSVGHKYVLRSDVMYGPQQSDA